MYLSFLLTFAFAGIPFYGHKASGIVLGVVILIAAAVYLFTGIAPDKIKPSPNVLNTIMLCVMMITIGYSSYAVIVIRSTANPPMDQDSPEDIFSLGEYLAREQYGSRPLLYGQAYSSEIEYELKKTSWEHTLHLNMRWSESLMDARRKTMQVKRTATM